VKPPLPIDPLLPEALAALAQARRLVLKAPPGAGKTTRFPAALLDAAMVPRSEEIWVLEPRRIAAKMAAERVARERGALPGEEIGYQVRFEQRASPRTRLRFVTEGILTRRLLEDAELRGIGAVVLDEFHERALEGDLALALLREVQEVLRPSLLLAVMSATLDPSPLAAYLDCPVLESAGRAHAVDLLYMPEPELPEIGARVARGLARLQDRGVGGSVLCFLPGAAEIRASIRALERPAALAGYDLRPLHGDLSLDEQQAAIREGTRPRIIVATNVAEASLTVEGVRAVIDTGLARVKRYDPRRRLDRLHTERISRSSAEQRAGRAGRLGPGVCVRLYSESEMRAWPESAEPEVQRCDLSGALLQLVSWGASRPERFSWLSAPPPEAIERGLALLSSLQAIEPVAPADAAGAADARSTGAADGRTTAAIRLTATGRDMLRYPVHPRIARVLLEARCSGVFQEAAGFAALAGERDLRLDERAFGGAESGHSGTSPTAPPRAAAAAGSDLYAQLDLLDQAEAVRFAPAVLREMGVDPRAARRASRARSQMLRLGPPASRAPDAARPIRHGPGGGTTETSPLSEEKALRALLAGYPDRVVRRHAPGRNTGLMVGGWGVRLDEGSVVREGLLFLALDAEAVIDREGRTVRVRTAARVEERWLRELFPEAFTTAEILRFDERSERVVALRRALYLDLPVEENETGLMDPLQASEALAEAALARADRALDWTRDASDLRKRFESLLVWEPSLGLTLDQWLRAAVERMCAGRRSFPELRGASLADALTAALPHDLYRLLEERAPARIRLPSGREARVEYRPGDAPVLAARVQEFFGSRSTPAVNRGRTPVLLHLLAPSQRPLQVTSDLESFWRNVYPKVRNELRARYPKHSWPEDPLQARPGGRAPGATSR
jgi:ATP-dependent helicase HrpB